VVLDLLDPLSSSSRIEKHRPRHGT
jgi:hypothetical protein